MKKYCIMIVDDDVNIGNMLQEALEKNNYSVLRAYSGTEALMVLEKKKSPVPVKGKPASFKCPEISALSHDRHSASENLLGHFEKAVISP